MHSCHAEVFLRGAQRKKASEDEKNMMMMMMMEEDETQRKRICREVLPPKLGVFSQSHYYLSLYRFRATEKDDLDVHVSVESEECVAPRTAQVSAKLQRSHDRPTAAPVRHGSLLVDGRRQSLRSLLTSVS
ncbi:hypothetical protein G5714_007454 [Onychostoma macrolepis]|uniref:Uncharacterized protein n=1 Tax=Onychostoma macrolepis TaxID=369639 RepID=A0A7J6D0E1_9TELE|nr:hypothetical protein G5714_007454 [Onychostoma macrolepis]